MMSPITVKFTMTRAEYVRAVRLLLLRQRIFWLLIPTAVTWALYPLIGYWLAKNPVFKPDTLVYPAAAIAFFSLIFGWSPIAAVKKINPAIRDNPQEFRFSDGGIDCSTGVSQSKLDWNLWIKYGESREFFLLYPSRQAAQIIPKRAFSSESELAAFRELLQKKLPKA